jgi:hypothetical protein
LKKNLAKNVTIILLIGMFIVGAVGSFVATFEMDGYVKLLNAYAPLYISLIASIGANSAVKKVKEAKDV